MIVRKITLTKPEHPPIVFFVTDPDADFVVGATMPLGVTILVECIEASTAEIEKTATLSTLSRQDDDVESPATELANAVLGPTIQDIAADYIAPRADGSENR